MIRCPHCLEDNSGHDAVDEQREPKAGDISLCAVCGEPSMFARSVFGLRLRILTVLELQQLQHDQRYRTYREVFTPEDDWTTNLRRWREFMKGQRGE